MTTLQTVFTAATLGTIGLMWAGTTLYGIKTFLPNPFRDEE